MRTGSRLLAGVGIASTLAFAGCGAHSGVFGAPNYISVTISPRVVSLPQAGSQSFSASVSNNLGIPQWSLLGASDPTSPGTLSCISCATTIYTSPPAPPVYVSARLQPGTVTIQATTTDTQGSMVTIVPDSVTFFITSPTISINLTPDTVTVPLGTSFQFTGYEVGSTNDGLNWYVNSVLGGLASTDPNYAGSITHGVTGGLYTAPAAVPPGGSSVTITMVPAANPTQSTDSFVSLQ
jgi:hypothetical protein